MSGASRLAINKPGLVMPRRLFLGLGVTLAAGAALGGEVLNRTVPMLQSASTDIDGQHH